MNKIEILDQEKLKSKVLLNNISNCLNNINYKIDELLKFKNQQDNIIQKFEIKCFNYNLVDKIVESKKEFSKNIEQIILELKSLDIISDGYSLDSNINKIKNINDVLKNTEIQLKNIEKEDFTTIEKLQINAIKKLKENGKFEKLDDGLKEIANLRIENPDIPLVELGKKLSIPIGKSGVNYRLKKIVKLAEE